MINIKKLLLRVFIATSIISALTGKCEITQMNVQTLDGLGRPCSSFSAGGQIGLEISCYNSESISRVYFEFYIFDPDNKEVFRHLGNSAPGNIGNKFSSVKNIPLTFYTVPGYYTFRGVVRTEPPQANPSEEIVKFRILPGFIDLFYPPDGIKDLADDPLVFRWYSSGADRYRIYLDENSGFFNPVWTAETDQSNIQYPSNPLEPRQKLSSGVVYWWKVEGLDARGNKILETRVPFSFTIKAPVVALSDVALDKIGFLIDSENEKISLFVDVKNLGGKAEYNIPVMAYFNGAQIGTVEKIELLQSGETKRILFDCSDRSMEILGTNESAKVVVSGMIDFTDDNFKNNILTAELEIAFEKAKISGRVTDGESVPGGIEGVSIIYSGPVSGEVRTDPRGYYKIENLPPGEYRIKAIKEGYGEATPLTVRIEKRKVYTGSNFILVKAGVEAVLLIGEPSCTPQTVHPGDSVTIQVRVKDNKGIEKVEILYQLPGEETIRTLEMKRISGDNKEGIYEAVIKQ